MNIHPLNPWESSGSEQPIQWRSWTFVWNIHSWLGRPRARSAMAPWLWCIPLLLATSLVVFVAARLLPQNPWKRGRIDHYVWNSSRTDLFCIFFFGVAKSQNMQTSILWIWGIWILNWRELVHCQTTFSHQSWAEGLSVTSSVATKASALRCHQRRVWHLEINSASSYFCHFLGFYWSRWESRTWK